MNSPSEDPRVRRYRKLHVWADHFGLDRNERMEFTRYLMRRGIRVCGFSPMQEDADAPWAQLIHGDDERISVENLGFGVRAIYHIVEAFCAQVSI